jgi:hypothetical protein
MFERDEFHTARFSSNIFHSRGPKTRSVQRVTVTLRSCHVLGDCPSNKRAGEQSKREILKSNLLPNLAVGNSTAHDADNPMLDFFRLDIHMFSALVERQNGLTMYETLSGA